MFLNPTHTLNSLEPPKCSTNQPERKLGQRSSLLTETDRNRLRNQLISSFDSTVLKSVNSASLATTQTLNPLNSATLSSNFNVRPLTLPPWLHSQFRQAFCLPNSDHNHNNNNQTMNTTQEYQQGAAVTAAPQKELANAAPDFAFNDEPVFTIDDDILLTSGPQVGSGTVAGTADDFFSSPEWTDPSPALTTSMSFNLDSCDTSPLLTDMNEAPELAGMPLFGDQVQFPLFSTLEKNTSFTTNGDVQQQNASNKRSPQMAFSRVKETNEQSALLLLRAFNSHAVANAEKSPLSVVATAEKHQSNGFASPAAILSPLPPTNATPSTPSLEGPLRGTKRRLDSTDLLPIDAPIQSRTYKTPSATSRKDLTDKQSIEPSTPDVSNASDPLAAKRLSNTLAARRSRHRKAEELKQLHDTIEELTSEVEMWKRRCMRAEQERDQAFDISA